MVDNTAGFVIAVSGTGVAEFLESYYPPISNDYRTTIHGAIQFLEGLIDGNEGPPTFSGVLAVNASGVNMATIGGTGASYYRFGN